MKILLVEDDERLSRSLARLLEQDRHNVEIAPDGETGVEIALGENGIDVVILDLGLPDISGLEVARRVRASKRELAILMLTARDTVSDRVVGLDSGRRRLPRQALRLRRARRPAAGPGAAVRGGRAARRAEARRRPDRARRGHPHRSRSTIGRSISARASSRSSSRSCATRARRSAATSSSTRPGRSAWP